jgi:hypothetical protein
MSAPFWAAALAREEGSPADGIHLLWTAPYATGYSVTGFDIQRRVSRWKPSLNCYTLTQPDLQLLHRALRFVCPVALVAVSAVPCPKPPGDPPDDPFHGAEGGGRPGTLACVDFAKLRADPPAPVDTIDGLIIQVCGRDGAPLPHAKLRTKGKMRGVDCSHRLDVELPAPSGRVVITLVSFAQPAQLTGFALDGSAVASAVMHAPSKRVETIALSGPEIARVRIDAPQDETLLLRLCWEICESSDSKCFPLNRLATGPHPNPLATPLATFVVLQANGTPVTQAIVERMNALVGLDCAQRVRARLAQPAGQLRVTLMTLARPATVRGLRQNGSVVSSATMRQHGRPETLTLNGPDIVALEIVAPAGETILLELCVIAKADAVKGDSSADTRGATPVASMRMGEMAVASVGEFTHGATPSLGSRRPMCLRYDIRLGGIHQIVQVVGQDAAMLAIALHEGKAVDSKFLVNANGLQSVSFERRSVDDVVLYTAQPLSGLTICVDVAHTSDDEEAEWSTVPYIATGIQLPVQAVNPVLASTNDEVALAESRLIAGETLDAITFERVAATMNDAAEAGPASPVWYTLRLRKRLQDPFIEMRPWPYALAMTVDAVWRRVLGFGFFDAGTGLTSGKRYDYRITGHFLRRDLEEQMFGFHTIPSGTTLPATFHLGPVRVTSYQTMTVELYPDVPDTALGGTSRKGIAMPSPQTVGPSLTLAFDTPVVRVILELEPARAGTLTYTGKTPDYYYGLAGTAYSDVITAAPRVTLDFDEPIDTIELRGTGFLYGVRLSSSTNGDPDDVLDRSVILSAVLYEATPAPLPPPAVGTTNLQQPIIPGDPAVTTQTPPQALGFQLHWVPPSPGAGAAAPWPTDLGAVPPSDVAAFLLERRRVDTGGAFETLSQENPPTLYFGNRGARPNPPPLYFGIDALVAFPEVPPVVAPVDPWIKVDDVLLSSGNPGGPPPGSMHQYRVYSVDVIGRRSATPTVGSIVRLEKHIAPPRPPGPQQPPPIGSVRPAGVRARVLQSTDPDLPADDIALLGASSNAIVLEWGWTADDRARDPYATEFRVYWQPLCPDRVRGRLVAPATLVGNTYQMVCTLDQAVAADAMKGQYFVAPDYPFKVAGHDAGTNITINFEQSALDPSRVPGASQIVFTPILTGAELRPGAWQERTAVISIGPGPADPAPYVFRDRLVLDATNTTARVWIGVSSADAQPYIADELPVGMFNGGRPGNESSIAPVVVEARYLGRPTFVVPPPLAAVPEDVSPEPVGPTVAVTIDLPARLPVVAIPVGYQVVVDRLAVGALIAALSQRADGTIGVQFPDDTTDSYTLGNPADQEAMRTQIATGEPARIENRFLMDALLRYPAQFEALWQRALPSPVSFAAVTDTLPSKAERWLYRVRLSDQAGHVSAGAAIVPRMVRVASTRTPGPPAVTVPNSTTDTLTVTGRVRDAFDLKWLVLFTLAVPDPSPIDARIRDKAQLLRTPDRRDLYPSDGLRLRLADGTLLPPALAVDIVTMGTAEVPDVVVTATLTPGYGKRVSLWAVTLTRDGIPSRFTGPATARTGPAPLVVPVLVVAAAAGIDTASWPIVTAPAEISIERSVDAGATWARVSPWLPATATTYTIPGNNARQYRLVLRGTRGQATAIGNTVTPV